MKSTKFLLSTLVVFSSFLFSCGQFTNFPAQYHLDGKESILNGTVVYSKDTVTVTQPKLIFKGEPGSVGVSFDKATIKYSVGDVKANTLSVSYRIDTSSFRDKDGNALAGAGSFELPIINRKVIDVGKTSSQAIYAEVTLSGIDDAGWPASIDLAVPISFLINYL